MGQSAQFGTWMDRVAHKWLPLVLAGILWLGIAGCKEAQPVVELRTQAPPPADLSQLDPDLRELIQLNLGRIDQSPEDAVRWADLAKSYQANELMELAETCWAQALARDPQQPDWWYFRAGVAESLGSPESALEYVDRSLAIDATYVPSWWRKGEWQLGLGQVDAAAVSFTRATELDANNPQGPIGTARVYLARGDAAGGAALLESLLEVHPNESYARFLLGNAYRTLGREDEALAELSRGFGTRIIRYDPWGAELIPLRVAFGARVQLGTQYMNDGQTDAATQIFESLRQERPDDVRVLAKLGQLYLRQNRVAESLGVLYDALYRHPNDAKVHMELTAAFMVTGDTVKALEHADRAIALNPTASLAYARKGTILRQAGRTDEATVSLLEAVKYDPSDFRLWKSLGDCQAKLRRWNDALVSYGRALEKERKDPELFALYGLAAMQSGQLAASEEALEQSLALGPKTAGPIQKLLEEVRRRKLAAGAG